VAFENTHKTPDLDPPEDAAGRLGIPLDDELRNLLTDERGPAKAPNPAAAVAQPGADERMVSIRVDAQRYEVLAELAAQEGLPPTTMARLLLNRAIREAAHHGSQL
jgi:hypothetical protein